MAITRTNWDPSLHPRGPVGRFIPIVDRRTIVTRHGSTLVTTKVRDDGNLEIKDIQTSHGNRGKGSGTAAMRATLDQADREDRITVLVPEPQDRHTDKRKLNDWYRSLGFVPNRGETRNPNVRGTHYWYRLPRGGSR